VTEKAGTANGLLKHMPDISKGYSGSKIQKGKPAKS